MRCAFSGYVFQRDKPISPSSSAGFHLLEDAEHGTIDLSPEMGGIRLKMANMSAPDCLYLVVTLGK